MCAIKPAHKKRLLLDVYTSDAEMTAKQFKELVLAIALATELRLNSTTRLRWHLKETRQKAE